MEMLISLASNGVQGSSHPMAGLMRQFSPSISSVSLRKAPDPAQGEARAMCDAETSCGLLVMFPLVPCVRSGEQEEVRVP